MNFSQAFACKSPMKKRDYRVRLPVGLHPAAVTPPTGYTCTTVGAESNSCLLNNQTTNPAEICIEYTGSLPELKPFWRDIATGVPAVAVGSPQERP